MSYKISPWLPFVLCLAVIIGTQQFMIMNLRNTNAGLHDRLDSNASSSSSLGFLPSTDDASISFFSNDNTKVASCSWGTKVFTCEGNMDLAAQKLFENFKHLCLPPSPDQ